MKAIFGAKDEVRLIAEFFSDTQNGYFVDVGAADPVVNSQSWPLEQAGWTGVLIEPRPDFAARLRQARRAKVFECACSSPRGRGTVRLNLLGGFSSLNERLVIAGMRPAGAIDVAARTLDDVLGDAQAPVPIDFVSVDVEGHELELLDGFDLARWRPRLILIEDHVLSLELHQTLQSRGYKWVRRTAYNGWYVPQQDAMTVSWLGRLQFFRKYYLALPTRKIRDAVRMVRAKLGILSPQRSD
jgi:FkbM family methyltransferase